MQRSQAATIVAQGRVIAHQFHLKRRRELCGCPGDEDGALILIGSHNGQLMIAGELRDLFHIRWIGAITRGKLLRREIGPLARWCGAERCDCFVEIAAGGARPHTNGDLVLLFRRVWANNTRSRDELATAPRERGAIARRRIRHDEPALSLFDDCNTAQAIRRFRQTHAEGQQATAPRVEDRLAVWDAASLSGLRQRRNEVFHTSMAYCST